MVLAFTCNSKNGKDIILIEREGTYFLSNRDNLVPTKIIEYKNEQAAYAAYDFEECCFNRR